MTSTAETHTDIVADLQSFDVGGEHLAGNISSPAAQQVLAAAHAHLVRPVCLCRPGGVEMYVARISADRYIVKRMPDTGLVHAPGCPSYLPPETLSGLGQVLGAAIQESADTGITALRLGFRMGKADRNAPAAAGPRDGTGDSVSADGTRLTLRAVLHCLWQEAGLAAWSPGMTGKRTWAVVSWYLRQAARGKITKGKPLATRLFVPEAFHAERKAELAARRLAAWAPARQVGRASQFMIAIGEVKAIEPARFGHKLVIKHLPDAPLMLDDDLHRRMQRRFANELELWQVDEQGHLMAIATFSVGRGGLATVQELSLMMTDQRWLPYDSPGEKILLDTATEQRRRFTKSLRYNLDPAKTMASLVFTDTDRPTAAYLVRDEDEAPNLAEAEAETGITAWAWVVDERAPRLPPPAFRPASATQ